MPDRKSKPREKPKPTPLVFVEWLDAQGIEGNVDEDDLKDFGVVLRSAGILISSNRDGVTLAQDVYTREKSRWRQALQIPRRYILRMVILEA